MRRVDALRNVRMRGEVGGTRLVDLRFDGGLIASIEPAADRAEGGSDDLDGRGLLAMPTVINAHAHVDKSWLGLPWQPYGLRSRLRHRAGGGRTVVATSCRPWVGWG